MSRELPNQSVERAFGLVDTLARNDALTLTELAAATGLSLSTASRLVSTLEQLKVVQRDRRTGLLWLGPRCILPGASALNATLLYRAARQVAQNLAAELGLGVNVAQLIDGRVTYLLNAEGRFAPRPVSLAGRTQSAHATGLGKVLLSELLEGQVAEVVGDEPLQAFTPFTITSREELSKTLALVRQNGYATEIEELAFGRACIAAPVRSSGGAICGAISISGPLGVIDPERRLPELSRAAIDSADVIASALDFHPTECVAV
jgi:DNA-binding IclR family transcriptional regulator